MAGLPRTSRGLFQCLRVKNRWAEPSRTMSASSTRHSLAIRVTATSQDRAWEEAVVRLYQTTRARSAPAWGSVGRLREANREHEMRYQVFVYTLY